MKINSRHGSIIHRTALALFVLCLGQVPIEARAWPHVPVNVRATSTDAPGGHDSIWMDIGSPVMGLVTGQSLRISVGNPLELPPRGEDDRKYKMLCAVTIIDAVGHIVAGGEEIAVDPGEFHSFDFKRAELPQAGEPGTGRIQVRVEIRRRFFNGFVSRFSQGDTDMSPSTIELINDATGMTMFMISTKPKEIVVVGSR